MDGAEPNQGDSLSMSKMNSCQKTKRFAPTILNANVLIEFFKVIIFHDEVCTQTWFTFN